jgi:hypothetical protein
LVEKMRAMMVEALDVAGWLEEAKSPKNCGWSGGRRAGAHGYARVALNVAMGSFGNPDSSVKKTNQRH